MTRIDDDVYPSEDTIRRTTLSTTSIRGRSNQDIPKPERSTTNLFNDWVEPFSSSIVEYHLKLVTFYLFSFFDSYLIKEKVSGYLSMYTLLHESTGESFVGPSSSVVNVNDSLFPVKTRWRGHKRGEERYGLNPKEKLSEDTETSVWGVILPSCMWKLIPRQKIFRVF